MKSAMRRPTAGAWTPVISSSPRELRHSFSLETAAAHPAAARVNAADERQAVGLPCFSSATRADYHSVLLTRWQPESPQL